MTADREKRLKVFVERRFNDISAKDARAAYDSGFPFGIAGLSTNAEEREFVERYAGVVLQRLLAREGT